MKPGKLVILFAVLSMALVACGGDEEVAEQIIESQDGVDDIEIDQNDGTVAVTIQGDDGETSAVIGGGEVPADFPIPVPGGGNVVAVIENPAGTTVSIEYPVGDFDSLTQYYDDWINSTGGEVSSFSGPDLTSWTAQVGDKVYNIAVADNDTEASVALIVADA